MRYPVSAVHAELYAVVVKGNLLRPKRPHIAG